MTAYRSKGIPARPPGFEFHSPEDTVVSTYMLGGYLDSSALETTSFEINRASGAMVVITDRVAYHPGTRLKNSDVFIPYVIVIIRPPTNRSPSLNLNFFPNHH